MAAEEIADLAATDARLKALTTELAAAVRARGSQLMDLRGIGPAGAARILTDVGDVARFPDRNHFASLLRLRPGQHLWTPPPVSRSDTDCRGPGTGGSTTCCTWPPSPRSASTPKAEPCAVNWSTWDRTDFTWSARAQAVPP